jgi:hypothetical protein
MGKRIDLARKRFGRWRVISLHPERRRYGKAGNAVAVLWHCRCDCGTERLVFGSNLRQGFSKSCGCAAREATRRRSTKHGHARRGQHTRVYDAWVHAKQRCYNPRNKDFPSYGGRNIGMHSDYRDDFLALYADVLDPPSADLTLDRINNDGNYEPGNLRWAPPSVQSANRRPGGKTVAPMSPTSARSQTRWRGQAERDARHHEYRAAPQVTAVTICWCCRSLRKKRARPGATTASRIVGERELIANFTRTPSRSN